ncbi:hypothetical protein J7T55_009650 [Diaporthe amygdali]|uniref:uncharacterized protein n=1 Tax=Phomopsis amygdali TaxID=1214568 RepID=UPI0022FDBDC8|nr:uncharacterized protein J7T55_009650 [Diaporthe amygdali]KAJ0109318.1 hypothetical protein J7T55_009650 [Diaporthe amygdali]
MGTMTTSSSSLSTRASSSSSSSSTEIPIPIPVGGSPDPEDPDPNPPFPPPIPPPGGNPPFPPGGSPPDPEDPDPNPPNPSPRPPPWDDPPDPPPGGNPPDPPPGGNPPDPPGGNPDPDPVPPVPPPSGDPPDSSGDSPDPDDDPDDPDNSGSTPDPDPGDDPDDPDDSGSTPDPDPDDPDNTGSNPDPDPGDDSDDPGDSGTDPDPVPPVPPGPPPGPPPGVNPTPTPSGVTTPKPSPTTAPNPTGSGDGECTTSAIASCMEEVHILTEYFTLSNGVSTSTVESVTETECVTLLTCDGSGTTITTTTSSSNSESPTATCTARLIVPQYEAKLGDASYFVPLCKSGSQTLWRNDGTNFKMDCEGVTFSTGETFKIPTTLSNATDSNCHDVATNGISICFSKRFPGWNATEDAVVIPIGDENPYPNITVIAKALETVGDSGGISTAGCGESDGYSRVAAYYFSSIQSPLEVITSSDQNVTQFSKDISSYSHKVISSSDNWLPQADEMLQNLACHITSTDGNSSRVVRALNKQSALHTGINTLLSITSVEESQTALRNLTRDLFDDYVSYIGRESSIIEGWTQAYRLCHTKWDKASLLLPQTQKPILDDIDGWYAKYFILASPGTTMDQLRGLEHALGVEGSETAPVDGNPRLWKAYWANLNLVQSTLPDYAKFINSTQRLVWDGKPADEDDPFAFITAKNARKSVSSRMPSTTANLDTVLSRNLRRQDSHSEGSEGDSSEGGDSDGDRSGEGDWEPRVYPAPSANAETVTDLEEETHLNVISQQKGQADSNTDSYTFAPPAGEGSWVFIVDSGFDLNHEFLFDETRDPVVKRKVLTYVVPNEKVGALTPDQIQEGWKEVPATIKDEDSNGHGTAVACVAGGTSDKIGVAPRTNLYLIKWKKFYNREKDGKTEKMAVSTNMCHIDAYMRIYNAWKSKDKKGEGIDPQMMLAWESCKYNSFSQYLLRKAEQTATDRLLMEKLVRTNFFAEYDKMGATVVFATSNNGYNPKTKKPFHYQADLLPTSLATDNSPYISVGGVYHDGSLWEKTTPPGAAPGTDNSDATISFIAAPQVAGLAAALLSYPWPKDENPFDPERRHPSIGFRMKTMLANVYAYQRLDHSEIVDEALGNIPAFPWDIPSYVPVIYNNVFGDQRCKDVDGFPNPPHGVGVACPGQDDSGSDGDDGGDDDSGDEAGSHDGSGDGPGNGSGGGESVGPGGDSTDTVFFTSAPTWLSSGWSSFSTVTLSANESRIPTNAPGESTNSGSSSSTTVFLNITSSASSSSTADSTAKSVSISPSSTVTQAVTESSTSTSTGSLPTASSDSIWTLSLYTQPGCRGDRFQFTGLATGNLSPCMSSPGTLSTDDPSSMSCTYVSHGHHGNAHEQNCSVGAWPFQPKSWAMTDAFCSVFHDDTCKLDIKEQTKYNSSQSCINAQSEPASSAAPLAWIWLGRMKHISSALMVAVGTDIVRIAPDTSAEDSVS